MQYHRHLQGFIYNLLRGSVFDQIHNKEGHKFFCFSNIFPANDLLENDRRTLIVSSPDAEFIKYLYEMLQQSGRVKEVKVGIMKFKIDSLHKLTLALPDTTPFSLITGTPIILRIPSEKYEPFDSETMKKYDYIYWRSDHPIDLFIAQVESNLLKKYAEYSSRNTGNSISNGGYSLSEAGSSFSFFQRFRFKKQISTRVSIKGFDQVVIGTVWEFRFNADIDKDLIQFALDAGLGERNSLGFGFMNLKL
jgi:CRISPR-associated endoribonuclease Cas6